MQKSKQEVEEEFPVPSVSASEAEEAGWFELLRDNVLKCTLLKLIKCKLCKQIKNALNINVECDDESEIIKNLFSLLTSKKRRLYRYYKESDTELRFILK